MNLRVPLTDYRILIIDSNERKGIEMLCEPFIGMIWTVEGTPYFKNVDSDEADFHFEYSIVLNPARELFLNDYRGTDDDLPDALARWESELPAADDALEDIICNIILDIIEGTAEEIIEQEKNGSNRADDSEKPSIQ